MAYGLQSIRLRRIIVSTLLWLIAAAAVTGIVWLVATTKPPGAEHRAVNSVPLAASSRHKLEIIFPRSAASGNEEVDRFVARFLEVCREGRYTEYRNMVSLIQDPFSESRFLRAYKSVRKLVITRIAEVHGLPAERFCPPVYQVQARVTYTRGGPGAAPIVKEPIILVFQEQYTPEKKKWVIYRPSESDMARLQAASTTQPVSRPATEPKSPGRG